MLNNTYAYVRARWVILVSIIGFVAPAFVFDLNQPLEKAVYYLVSYSLIGLLLWWIWGRNLESKDVFGTVPNGEEAWICLMLGTPSVCAHFAGKYLLFVPLSFVVPQFVSWWLFETSTTLFDMSFTREAILVNGLMAFNLVILVPIVEEIVFRGFLLHRWCEKFGEKRGVVLSSMLFSIIHKDILGNLVVSVIVSVFCLHRKSLVGPILIHAGNNLMVVIVVLFVWVVGGEVVGPLAASTVEEFRSGWWFGAFTAVVSVPWLYWFVKTRLLESNASC